MLSFQFGVREKRAKESNEKNSWTTNTIYYDRAQFTIHKKKEAKRCEEEEDDEKNTQK